MQQSESTTPVTYARSIEGAAKSIGISRAGLYRLISGRQIRTFKIGCRTLIAESEIQRFMSERVAAAA